MRLLTINLLATALVLFGAASASASSLTVTSDYDGVTPLLVGQTVELTVTLDVDEAGVQAVGFGVTYDPTILQYNQRNYIEAGGISTYILYTPQGMSGFSLYMIPGPETSPEPQWGEWVFFGGPPPGLQQVQVQWGNAAFSAVQTTGVNVIARLEFEVIAVDPGNPTPIEVDASDDLGGTIFQVNNLQVVLPVNGNANGDTLNVFTPEPSTAILVGLGLVGLGVAGRRR